MQIGRDRMHPVSSDPRGHEAGQVRLRVFLARSDAHFAVFYFAYDPIVAFAIFGSALQENQMAEEPNKKPAAMQANATVRYVDRPECTEIFADSIIASVFDGQTLRLEFGVTASTRSSRMLPSRAGAIRRAGWRSPPTQPSS